MKQIIILIIYAFCVLPIIAQQHRTGQITAIENGKIYINIGEDSVNIGDRFIVITNNEYFTHPITGALIPKNSDSNAVFEIEMVFKDFSQAKPVSNSIVTNIEVGMQIDFENIPQEIKVFHQEQSEPKNNKNDEFVSEEEKYLKTMVEATNMNCPQKISKHQTFENVELTDVALIHYYTYSKKYYKMFSKEKLIQKSIKDLTKSYRKEMKKEQGKALKKMFTALLKTGRYVEHVYYNPDHSESFSYRIYMEDVFKDK